MAPGRPYYRLYEVRSGRRSVSGSSCCFPSKGVMMNGIVLYPQDVIILFDKDESIPACAAGGAGFLFGGDVHERRSDPNRIKGERYHGKPDRIHPTDRLRAA